MDYQLLKILSAWHNKKSFNPALWMRPFDLSGCRI